MITIEDVDATIRTLGYVRGTEAETEIAYWKGFRKALEAYDSNGAPVRDKAAGDQPTAINTELSRRSKESQLKYWSEVRRVMSKQHVAVDQARKMVREKRAA